MRLLPVLLLIVAFPIVSAAQAPFVKELQQPKSDWDKGYFKNATVGDFASYLSDRGNLRRPEIVAVGDREVTVAISATINGQASQGTQLLKFTGPDFPKGRAPGKPTRAKFKVGDRELDCEVTVHVSPDGKMISRYWTSPLVPFGGRVKGESYRVGADGKEEFTGGETLTDFKFAKAPK